MEGYFVYKSYPEEGGIYEVEFFLSKSLALSKGSLREIALVDDDIEENAKIVCERINLNSLRNKKKRLYYYDVLITIYLYPKCYDITIKIENTENFINQINAMHINCSIAKDKQQPKIKCRVPIISSSGNEKLIRTLAWIKFKDHFESFSSLMKEVDDDLENFNIKDIKIPYDSINKYK